MPKGELETLAAHEIAALKWAVVVNDEYRIGLYWPTVKRRGPLPELADVRRAGLVTLRTPAKPRPEAGGYWITTAGRARIAALETEEKK